ncbi:MAG: lysophospholipid acyltransferase family protein [Betaproteobacteria bacterium]|nr:lysophospholipid acyltransferase family protein [Betaproteobacteria bacterium]
MQTVQLILRLFARLPLRFWHTLGALGGVLVFRFNTRYATRLKDNLLRSGIASDEAEQQKLLHDCVRQLGMAAAEVVPIWFRSYADVLDLVTECVGWEHVEDAVRGGKGVLAMTPHLGCFEIVSLYYVARYPMAIMYKPPRQHWAEVLMCAGRDRGLASLATADKKGVRIMLAALKRGEAVGILPDQVASTGDGVWASFFGRPAYTPTLPGRLANLTGAVPLIMFGERLAQSRGYRIHITPLPHALSEDKATATRELNAALETLIRKYPAQYLWSYNRYKQPGGVAPPDA